MQANDSTGRWLIPKLFVDFNITDDILNKRAIAVISIIRDFKVVNSGNDSRQEYLNFFTINFTYNQAEPDYNFARLGGFALQIKIPVNKNSYDTNEPALTEPRLNFISATTSDLNYYKNNTLKVSPFGSASFNSDTNPGLSFNPENLKFFLLVQ